MNPSQRTYMDISHSNNWNENIGGKMDITSAYLTEVQAVDKVVCSDGGSRDMVKDICIDEGLHSVEKIVIENVGEKVLSIDHSVTNRNDDPSKELTDGATTIAHDSLSRSVSEPLICVDKDTEEEHSFDSLFNVGGKMNSTEQNVVDYSDEIGSKKLFPPENYHADPQKGCPVSSRCSDNDRQTIIQATVEECSVCTAMPSNTNKVNEGSLIKESLENAFSESMLEECSDAIEAPSNATESDKYCRIESDTADGLSEDEREEGHSTAPYMTSDTKENTHENWNLSCLNISIDSTLQDGTQVAPAVSSDAQLPNQNNGAKENTASVNMCNFNPRETDTSGTDGGKNTLDGQQPAHVQSNLVVEESLPDGRRNSVVSSVYHNHGEVNLSGSDVSSGQTASLGYIPYSGSISFRSESSATSTRSFAFPILQNEWSSSPVKMAKAKRRRFKNYQSWKSGLLCCKF
ncbi:uncharacterized protein [Typha angustifolia]|uniref:uncharacterized protein n=1 Tax=Typha angustifolia TaxID=59011 RepID=UPI003C2ADEC3